MKHTPQIRLINARIKLRAAEQACPHWDYESDGDSHSECCYVLDEAKRELRAAKRAIARDDA